MTRVVVGGVGVSTSATPPLQNALPSSRLAKLVPMNCEAAGSTCRSRAVTSIELADGCDCLLSVRLRMLSRTGASWLESCAMTRSLIWPT